MIEGGWEVGTVLAVSSAHAVDSEPNQKVSPLWRLLIQWTQSPDPMASKPVEADGSEQ